MNSPRGTMHSFYHHLCSCTHKNTHILIQVRSLGSYNWTVRNWHCFMLLLSNFYATCVQNLCALQSRNYCFVCKLIHFYACILMCVCFMIFKLWLQQSLWKHLIFPISGFHVSKLQNSRDKRKRQRERLIVYKMLMQIFAKTRCQL